eukprot:9214876-Pyramimonas_sp.AAC.1
MTQPAYPSSLHPYLPLSPSPSNDPPLHLRLIDLPTDWPTSRLPGPVEWATMDPTEQDRTNVGS